MENQDNIQALLKVYRGIDVILKVSMEALGEDTLKEMIILSESIDKVIKSLEALSTKTEEEISFEELDALESILVDINNQSKDLENVQ